MSWIQSPTTYRINEDGPLSVLREHVFPALESVANRTRDNIWIGRGADSGSTERLDRPAAADDKERLAKLSTHSGNLERGYPREGRGESK